MTPDPTAFTAEKKRKAAALYPRPCTREAMTESEANRRATKANRTNTGRILTQGYTFYCAHCRGFHFNQPKRSPKKSLA